MVRGRSPEDSITADIRRLTRAHYHKARKLVIKNNDVIKSEKLAESLAGDPICTFWKNVKKCRTTKNPLSSVVDDKQDPISIATLFKDKFENLFNSVPYSIEGLNELNNDIDHLINLNRDVNNSTALFFSPENVSKAISKLKVNKNDGSLPLTSDNILNSTNILNGHLALLFSAMVRHGVSPSGMLVGTMVPIPKSRWKHSDSTNYRAITISSLFGKILDNMILDREADKLITNELQFGFKPESSTTMCSSMIRETISYFVDKNTTVYGLVLDATKAFDRLNYCKLF